MSLQLETYATSIIACAENLLGGGGSTLNDKQCQSVKIILGAAEHFLHLYAECLSMSTEDRIQHMRHALANPLTPIRGYSQLLVMGVFGELNDQQLAQVRTISDITDQVQTGIDQMAFDARRRLDDTQGQTA